MSKVAKIVGIVATVVAVAASIAIIVGSGGTAAPFVAATWAEVAAIAGAVAAVASTIAQVTAKTPDAKGAINQVVIGRNMAVPYVLGRTYVGGFQVYDRSGGENNKDRTQIMVVSGAGPVEAFESLQADYTPVTISPSTGGNLGEGEATGYYSNFLWVDTRKGARPETAFTNAPSRSPLPDWDSTYKLSGYAAYRVTMKFDKDAERWSSGVPQWGVVLKGAKVYDPRLDSTYPGGSGACRWTDEATFTWGTGTYPSAENPAIGALNYARGRFIEKTAAGAALVPPVKIVGCGFDFDEIEVAQFVELANICDANGWKVGGPIYEGPGLSKWDNLKRILAACAAEPTWTGGKLGVKFSAPRISVVTIGLPDLADGESSVQAMKGWRDKVNTVVPRVRLEAHRWEYTQIEEVTNPTYLAEDGEPKSFELQFDLVQVADQGAELAAYHLANGREFGPITLPLKPAFMVYDVGEAVDLDIPELGLENQLAVILARQIDPQNGSVLFTLESETTAKHDFALGRTGVAPPSPTIIPPDQGDVVAAAPPTAQTTQLIGTSSPTNLTATITTAGVVTVSAHNRLYSDKTVPVTGATVAAPAGAVAGDTVVVFYDDPNRAGGAVVYQKARMAGGAGQIDLYYPSATNPYRHFVIALPVPTTGTGSGGSGTGAGSGGTGGGGAGGGGGWNVNSSI